MTKVRNQRKADWRRAWEEIPNCCRSSSRSWDWSCRPSYFLENQLSTAGSWDPKNQKTKIRDTSLLASLSMSLRAVWSCDQSSCPAWHSHNRSTSYVLSCQWLQRSSSASCISCADSCQSSFGVSLLLTLHFPNCTDLGSPKGFNLSLTMA